MSSRDPAALDLLVTFEEPLAHAVARLLRREGVPATVAPAGPGEAGVLVPAVDRERAFAVLARHMEELAAGGLAAEPPEDAADSGDERPLVTERLRRLGFLPLLLVPLLVISLAAVRVPLAWAVVILIGGVAVVHALRERGRDS